MRAFHQAGAPRRSMRSGRAPRARRRTIPSRARRSPAREAPEPLERILEGERRTGAQRSDARRASKRRPRNRRGPGARRRAAPRARGARRDLFGRIERERRNRSRRRTVPTVRTSKYEAVSAAARSGAFGPAAADRPAERRALLHDGVQETLERPLLDLGERLALRAFRLARTRTRRGAARRPRGS